MARRVSEPTYRQFLLEESARFDERDQAYSRLARGEFIPQGRRTEEADSGSPTSRGLSPIHGFLRRDGRGERRRGHSRTDYALRWGGRTVDYGLRRVLMGREMVPDLPPVEIKDVRRVTDLVERAAHWFGADLVGFTRLNRAWLYSHWGEHSIKGLDLDVKPGDPVELPERLTYVVVLAVAMDYDLSRRSPAMEPTEALSYSKAAAVAVSLARFIQELGYHALPSLNDTGLCIPLAADAGLGEMGRNGLLFTERFGPRVRLAKVFTELEVVPSRALDLGVQTFCETCSKCARSCPAGAISAGKRTPDGGGISQRGNLLKWQVDPERCVRSWISNSSHCSNCIRVCPFNKPDTLLHRMVRWQVAHVPALDRLSLWFDDRLGYGSQVLGDADDELF